MDFKSHILLRFLACLFIVCVWLGISNLTNAHWWLKNQVGAGMDNKNKAKVGLDFSLVTDTNSSKI